MRIGLLLAAIVALATAAGLEGVPTDSRLYDDFDLLKTSGLIHSMPATSRPWTRGECVRLLLEARGGNPGDIGPAQLAALKRLEFEFGSELPTLPARRPSPASAPNRTTDVLAWSVVHWMVAEAIVTDDTVMLEMTGGAIVTKVKSPDVVAAP